MKDDKNAGGVLIVALLGTALVAALGFGTWAFMSRQDYKDNVDKKIADAITIAVEQAKTAKDNEFIEKDKQPLKDYQGPGAYGSVLIKYPKSWSGYINDAGKSSTPLDGTFHPGVVPADDKSSTYGLRLQVKDSAYDAELKQFDDEVKNGKVTVSPFRAAKVPGVLGSRVDGEITSQKRGSLILLPLRDKTLKIWTESDQFLNDFNNFILPNFSFSP